MDSEPAEHHDARAHLIALGFDEGEIEHFDLSDSNDEGYLFSFNEEIDLPALQANEATPRKYLCLQHHKDKSHNVEHAQGLISGYQATFVFCTSSYDSALDLCSNREGDVWVAKNKNTPVPENISEHMTALFDQYAISHFNDGLFDLERALGSISNPNQLRPQLERITKIIRSILS